MLSMKADQKLEKDVWVRRIPGILEMFQKKTPAQSKAKAAVYRGRYPRKKRIKLF